MIYLASSSPTRAKILRQAGIKFTQIPFSYDENIEFKGDIYTHSYEIVMAKKEQFFKVYSELNNVLFVDSLVVVGGEALGKAKDDNEAFYMLQKQSGNEVSVVSAMLYCGDFELSSISITTYKFAKFNDEKMREYIKNKEYVGKAGAMSIESFNKEYILSQKGNTSTTMGLNVEILKAYL
ncbi:MAG: septum formation inhibitor Maf [Campylobacter sp.]|nr:septum formation inhibitor Maf [Campylobacter sp.]